MSIPSRSIARPVAVAMLFVAVAFIGGISLLRLPIDLLPDIAYPKLVIYTSYPNIPPSEIEATITTRIENQLNRIPGKERIESVSREGLSIVTLRFAWGTNMDFAVLNVRDALDAVRNALPTGADPPILLRTDPTAQPFMSLSVTTTSGDLRNLRELAETVIRRRLEQLDGVAQASVVGGVEREIHIDIDPATLEEQGTSLTAVKNALDAANISGGSGQILRGRYRYNLRTLGEFQSVQQIGDVVIRKSTPPGSGPAPAAAQYVPLRQIATIQDGIKDRESIIRYNGQEAIGLLLFKESGSNTVIVSDTVHKVLNQLRTEYPQLTIDVASDQAGFISAALGNVEQEVWLGGVLAFLVLFLFLRDWRYPVAIALAMPLSVIATFALLDAAHISLNIMSLGGLALGVGLLMDNSIVVIENIFRHRELGLAPAAAAALGTEEVQAAITTSTLTTIAVFGPIIYVQGVAGQLFASLSLAVAFSLSVSVAVAITLLPAMAARWKTGKEPEMRVGFIRRGLRAVGRSITGPVGRTFNPMLDGFDRGFDKFTEWYEHLLAAALRHRGRVIAMAVLIFAVTAALAFDLKRSVLPAVDQGGFRVQVTLARGTPITETEGIAQRLDTLIRADSAVDAVFTLVGRQIAVSGMSEEESGINTAFLDVRLKPGLKTPPVIARIEPKFSQFPPNTIAIVTGQATALSNLLGTTDADLSVHVTAQDPDSAFAYAQRLEQKLNGVASITNVQLDTRLGQPETRIEVDRERAASVGLTPAMIGQQVNDFMRGVSTGNAFPEFDRKVPIIVRLPEDDRTSLERLKESRLQAGGATVALNDVITTHDLIGPAEIHRLHQKRYVGVQADVAKGDLASATRDIQAAIGTVPPGFDIKIVGENEEMRRSFVALGLAIVLAILLCYMILAAEFESFVHPFTVMLSVPLGTFGAVVALWITGAGLNTVSLIGMVVLVGIVDNDAVVKVDFINQCRRQGMSVRDSIYAAGHSRLRPILINTITALLGLLPMAMGIGPGAELQAPLAIAVFGGLVTATALTLIVIPVVYDLLEELRLKMRALMGWSPVEEPRQAEAAAAAQSRA